jgi:hypothetical protein
MMKNIDRQTALHWYNQELSKSLKSRNYHTYHACCHSYSTRKHKKIIKGHQKDESFSFKDLFSFTEDNNEKYAQVNAFWQKYCEPVYGDLPWKNVPHVKKASDLTDEDEAKPVKEEEEEERDEEENESKAELTVDSRDDQDWPLEDPQKQRLLDFREYKENLLGFEVSKLRVALVRETEKRERLAAELSSVKAKMAEQQQLLEAVTSKLDSLMSGPLAGLLGKRAAKQSDSESEGEPKVSGGGHK